MSASTTVALGAIAGGTIFLGLPLGRLDLSQRTRQGLATLSAGILLFIFWDVISASVGFVEESLDKAKDGGSWTPFATKALMLGVGFAVGVFALAAAERAIMARRPRTPMAGGSAATAEAGGLEAGPLISDARRSQLTLGMLIAVAIGVHNFSEGLAIGVSARAGEVALAGTLIVGFALHNATEGFGIVGPLQSVKPSWRWLAVAGLVGGGPTFLGTLIGYRVSSEPLQLVFLAVAAGAILFVVGELWTNAARRVSRNVVLAGITCGFALGLATDLVLGYAGG